MVTLLHKKKITLFVLLLFLIFLLYPLCYNPSNTTGQKFTEAPTIKRVNTHDCDSFIKQTHVARGQGSLKLRN